MKETNNHILIVEDDEGIQSQLKWCFDDYEVVVAGERIEAIEQLRRYQPAVVLLDLGLPPDPGGATEGIATLEEILSIAPDTKVIVVTGNNDHDNAVKCIGQGAYDFYAKPIDQSTLTLVVDRAYRVYELERENRQMLQNQQHSPLDGIIASSPQMLKACRTVEKIAPSDITTLLLGESGTGKELFARALHELSPRSSKKMVSLNCAAIPGTLLESELFGYEKGAFTGAAKQTKGKIEYADGGTLFLDEIGDLPMELQPKLLRFIQERVFERVGGRQEISVDLRIVCATHQNLKDLIDQGLFREDLYYRISEVSIPIPPLRERDGDAIVLAKAFIAKFNQELDRSIKGFTNPAISAIEKYDWPGNVREIESRIKRAVIMADGNQITPEDLDLEENDDSLPLNLKEVREEAERKAIIRALNYTDNNISQTAKALGLTRPTLYTLMEKYHLKS
ncbi:MAG: PEP-CTERM-box response regulator transcription factor [Sedimenticola sp.]